MNPKARRNVRIRTSPASTHDTIHGGLPTIQRNAHSQSIDPCTNVFINYIPPEFNEQDLRDLCAPFGNIQASKIMINLDTGQSKCFGFVRFEKLEEAKAAIQGLNGKTIGTKRLLAKYAESHDKKEKVSSTVYIKRLPMDCDQEFVVQLFSQFGKIIQVIPHVIESAEPQYWRCFVRYTNFASATNAISVMNNQIIIPNTRPIHVRYGDESRITPATTQPESTRTLDVTDERMLLPSFFFM